MTTSSGEYALEGEELALDNGMRFTLNEAGGLTDQDGDALRPAQPPESSSGEDFVGAWVYDDYNILVSIYQDGACEVSWDNGTCNSGACQMEGGVLYLELDDGTVMALSLYGDGLMDQDGDTLSRIQGAASGDSEGDWYAGEDAEASSAGGDYAGCWTRSDEYGSVWLTIFGDGTYMWIWDDGFASAGGYWLEDSALVLESGARFTLSGDGGIVEDDGHAMYPGQVPDDLSGPLNGR